MLPRAAELSGDSTLAREAAFSLIDAPPSSFIRQELPCRRQHAFAAALRQLSENSWPPAAALPYGRHFPPCHFHAAA